MRVLFLLYYVNELVRKTRFFGIEMSSIAEFVVILSVCLFEKSFPSQRHQRWWPCLGVDGEMMSVVVGQFLR